jgi:hypothetical protein
MVEQERKEILQDLSTGISVPITNTSREAKIELLQKIGSHDEAPEYMKDNEYIKHGYRINYNTFNRVFRR